MSVGIGLGGLGAPAPVAAMPDDGGDADPRTVEARRYYQEGNAAMKLHQWEGAREAYLQAWRQRPHWQVAGSLGEVALFTSKGRKARENHESATGPNAAAEASFKSVALWSFVAAGAVGGGTLVYEIISPRSSRPLLRGSVVVGPTGAAAMLQGEF